MNPVTHIPTAITCGVLSFRFILSNLKTRSTNKVAIAKNSIIVSGTLTRSRKEWGRNALFKKSALF